MKLLTILALALGAILFAWLLMHYGAAEVVAGAAAAGWGVVWVSLYRFVTIAAHGAGWRALFPAGAAPGFAAWFRARWAGEAINSLLPVAQVGGDVARAQMVARHTSSGALAGATVVVDFTLGLVAQLFYTVLGVVLLAQVAGNGAQTRSFVTGLAMAALLLAAFFLLQSSNVLGRLAEKLAQRQSGAWGAFAGGIGEVSRQVSAIYADRKRVAACFTWRLFAWMLMTVETWLALRYLGARTSWSDSIVIEGLTMAVRSAAFAVPGAVGVQEGGFVLVGTMLGLSPETALALALVKRVRELAVGIPGLMVSFARNPKRQQGSQKIP